MLQPEDLVAEAADGVQVVGDEDDGAALGAEGLDLVDAAALEVLVADGEDLIDEEDLGVGVGGDGEAQAQGHARGVGADGVVDELAQLSEGDDVGDELLGVGGAEAEQRAVHADVLAAGEVAVEAEAEVEQGGQRGAQAELPLCGAGDAGDELHQGALARAVVADDAEGLPAPDLERDVAQRPVLGVVAAGAEELVEAAAVVEVDVEALAQPLGRDHPVRSSVPASRSDVGVRGGGGRGCRWSGRHSRRVAPQGGCVGQGFRFSWSRHPGARKRCDHSCRWCWLREPAGLQPASR